jgi:hypothetical protein
MKNNLKKNDSKLLVLFDERHDLHSRRSESVDENTIRTSDDEFWSRKAMPYYEIIFRNENQFFSAKRGSSDEWLK